PPLFRAKRGRSETFIKDERDLEAYLIRRASESRVIELADGTTISGNALERLLERVMGFRKLLQVVERRVPLRRATMALLQRDARDLAFWGDRSKVSDLADTLRTEAVTATLVEDAEHQAFAINIEDRESGYGRRYQLGLDFVTAGEFRTLASAYPDVSAVIGAPVTIRTTAAAAATGAGTPETDAAEAADAETAADRPTSIESI